MTSNPSKNRQLLPPGGDEVYVGRVVATPAAEKERTETELKHSATDEPLGKFGRSKLAILVTVFVAAGILGLPLIVLSPAFSKTEKVFWTLIVLCYTVMVFYILWLLVGYTVALLA